MNDINENNKDKIPSTMAEEDINRLSLKVYEVERNILRLTKLCGMTTTDTDYEDKLAETYKMLIIDEKYALLDLMRKQYHLLKDINTPDIIMKNKQDEIQLVNNRIEELKEKTPTGIWGEFQMSIQLAINNEIENLSTGFVDSEWPKSLALMDSELDKKMCELLIS